MTDPNKARIIKSLLGFIEELTDDKSECDKDSYVHVKWRYDPECADYKKGLGEIEKVLQENWPNNTMSEISDFLREILSKNQTEASTQAVLSILRKAWPGYSYDQIADILERTLDVKLHWRSSEFAHSVSQMWPKLSFDQIIEEISALKHMHEIKKEFNIPNETNTNFAKAVRALWPDSNDKQILTFLEGKVLSEDAQTKGKKIHSASYWKRQALNERKLTTKMTKLLENLYLVVKNSQSVISAKDLANTKVSLTYSAFQTLAQKAKKLLDKHDLILK